MIQMSDFTSGLRCEKCGGTSFDSLVQYGSYILRCGSCCEPRPVTSWRAVGPKWTGTVRVFRDGEQSGKLLLAGVGADIWLEVSRLAADGTTLILR
jgi:hypothetical protein